MNALVIFAPALIGVFWGAPLVAREFETGTFRLAWTEGVTRRSWIATKLAGIGLASMLVTGAALVVRHVVVKLVRPSESEPIVARRVRRA